MFPSAGWQRGRGPMPQTSTYIDRPRPTSRPFAFAASRSFLSSFHLECCERRVERLGVVARVVDGAHLRLEGELVRGDEVLSPDVGGIHVELARQHVHRALDEVGGLRPSRAAIRVGRCLVGEDFRQRRPDGRDVVGRIRHQHRERGDGGGEQHVVGADVGNEPHLEAQHGAVTLRRKLDVAEDVAAVRRRNERLGPILDPLDGNPQPLGHGGGDVLFPVDVDLRAEAAADLRERSRGPGPGPCPSSPRSSSAGCAGSASTTRWSSSLARARSARRHREAPSRSAPAAG